MTENNDCITIAMRCVSPVAAVAISLVASCSDDAGKRSRLDAGEQPFDASTHTSEPKIYWGTHISGVPWDMKIADAFAASIGGKTMSTMHWGQDWIRNGGFQDFPLGSDAYPGPNEVIRRAGAIPVVSWFSTVYEQSRDLSMGNPNPKLADIINGKFDDNIRAWATKAKAWGYPFFLRFNSEMNGNWWPYSELTNENKAGEFVQAWRHVHDIFTQVGAKNVTWVWCVNIEDSSFTPIETLYPGDAYVDWTSLDGYNWGTTPGYGGWKTFTQTLQATYYHLLSIAPNKPIMLAETASTENGGSKAEWITAMLTTELPANFPRIKSFNWYNINDGVDWPIDTSAAALSAFSNGIKSSYYLGNVFTSLPKDNPVPVP